MSRNDWHTFKEGQARLSGGIRGWDELRHDTFAVRLDGVEYFGEIKKVWLPNQNDFNQEILSFGYRDQGDVGMPLPCLSSRSFSSFDIERVMSLVMQPVQATAPTEESANSHFKGQVLFREGWALVTDATSEGAP